MATKSELVDDILKLDPKADVSEEMKHEQLSSILAGLKEDQEETETKTDDKAGLKEEVKKAAAKGKGKGEAYKGLVWEMACAIASNPNYDTRTGVNMPQKIAEEAVKVTNAVIHELN